MRKDTTMRLSRKTIIAVAGVALAAVSVTSCQTQSADASEEATRGTGTVSIETERITVPPAAVKWADAADGTSCGAVNADLILGTIAATSGFDAGREKPDTGGAGWSGFASEPWKVYGTGNDADRADGQAAITAVAARLCDSYRSAAVMSEDGVRGSVDDLALSTYLVGEHYTRQYGVTPAGADWDPHGVRADITNISTAAASARNL